MYAVLATLSSSAGFNPGDPEWGFWLNLAAIALAIIGPPSIIPLILHFVTKPKKQLSYQVESDAALIDRRKDLGPDMRIFFQGGSLVNPTPVDEVRLMMYKIINTGSEDIHESDFLYGQKNMLRFEFEEAGLILCAIHHTEPDDLIPVEDRKEAITLGPLPANPPSPPPIYIPPHVHIPSAPSFYQYVDLHGLTLEKGYAVILKFVTQGKVKLKERQPGMRGPQGRLKKGKIVKYTPSLPVFTVSRILIGLLIALVIVASITVFGTFRQNNCVLSFSPVKIGGSSAFYNTVQAQANSYHQGCPFATLNVESGDSGVGLFQLEQGKLDIANSEISLKEAKYNYSDLSEHQVAVIVFTIILNRSVTGITSLSRDQLTGIYDGRYTNWKQLPGGPDLPIIRFNRPSDSGTHASFSSFVLKGSATAPQTTLSTTQQMIDNVSSTGGAIGYADLGSANQASNRVTAIAIDGNAPTPGLVENGTYPFWAIERMYTRQANGNSLISTFIDYVINNIPTNTTFIRKGDMQKDVLATHG